MALLERDAFLERLNGLLEESGHGEGRLALVIGEPGIGKTSLLDGFARQLVGPGTLVWGNCDPVVPARPLAPLVDFSIESPALRIALAAGDRDGLLDAFLAWMGEESRLVMIFEDLQWADTATLDLLRILAPRLRRLPHLVVGTYRDNEVGPVHPLQMCLERFPSHTKTVLRLPPLSLTATANLLTGTGHDPARFHALTGGNPYYLTELMAHDAEDTPPTITRSVRHRLDRLSFSAQRVVKAASLLHVPFTAELVSGVSGEGDRAVAEALACGMLVDSEGGLSFRHDLTRQAVATSLDDGERISWNREALRLLEESPGADPAHVVQHAIGAGDEEATIRWAVAAAEAAEALGAHREAADHRLTAIGVSHRLSDRLRADLLEAHARSAAASDDIVPALGSQQQAIELWTRIEEPIGRGLALSRYSMFQWVAGDGVDAIRSAEEAVRLLESACPMSRELARAYAVAAQRHMVAGNDDEARRLAERAAHVACEVGDEEVQVDVAISLGAVDIYGGDDTGWSRLEANAKRARTAGLKWLATRALINLVEGAKDHYRMKLASRFAEEAHISLSPYDQGLYPHFLELRQAEIDLELGHWEGVDQRISAMAEDPTVAGLVRARALVATGRLRARRGTGDPWGALDRAGQLLSNGEPQDLRILYLARAEAAWLAGDTLRTKAEAEVGLAAIRLPENHPAWWSELAFWAWKGGSHQDQPTFEPFALQVEGRAAEAAQSWEHLGCRYFQALALSDSAALEDLDRALALFLELGATPMARRVAAVLQSRGVRRIRRGPRPSTRQNPSRLTNRQMEILTLLGEGLTNRQIADRLVISPKTVDHHVSTILSKLGVSTRVEAAVSAMAQNREPLSAISGAPPDESASRA